MDKKSTAIVIVILLVIIASAFIFFGRKSIPTNTSVNSEIQGIQKETEVRRPAHISLLPESKTLKVGDTISVDIVLDTGGEEIYGVDINSLRYDPTLLGVVNAGTGKAEKEIKAGTLMGINAENKVDDSVGTIKFSQLSSPETKFNGKGVLATVTFKTKKEGTAKIDFDFNVGSTTDTNVAGKAGDLLGSVSNATYLIENAVKK